MSTDISNNLFIEIDSETIEIEFKVGEKIEHKWKNSGIWYPGSISIIDISDQEHLYTLEMDDGDKAYKVKSDTIRKLQNKEEIDANKRYAQAFKEIMGIEQQFSKTKTIDLNAGLTAETFMSNDPWSEGEFIGAVDSEDEMKEEEKKEELTFNNPNPMRKMACIHRLEDPRIDDLKKETRGYADSDSGDECNNIKNELQKIE